MRRQRHAPSALRNRLRRRVEPGRTPPVVGSATPGSPHLDWRPHPWHGLEVGPEPPAVVTAFIEITPFDTVKYEINKETGYLCVDRPQLGASYPPTLYGFVPRTYCGDRVAALSAEADAGDGDPLDICVIADRPGDRADITVATRVIGGIHMIDSGQADDKIIGILAEDPVWQAVDDLDDLPEALVDRLVHYFSTYKELPGSESSTSVPDRYGRDRAHQVVDAAVADYWSFTRGS